MTVSFPRRHFRERPPRQRTRRAGPDSARASRPPRSRWWCPDEEPITSSHLSSSVLGCTSGTRGYWDCHGVVGHGATADDERACPCRRGEGSGDHDLGRLGAQRHERGVLDLGWYVRLQRQYGRHGNAHPLRMGFGLEHHDRPQRHATPWSPRRSTPAAAASAPASASL